jgi:hypothetical protein
MDMAKLIEFRVNLLNERSSILKHSAELVRGLKEAAMWEDPHETAPD